jgi:hypothetical protein
MTHDAGLKVPTGDELFEHAAEYGSVEAEPNGKGTAGHDAQNRRPKGEDEPPKGTAGHDGQNRRN